MSGITSITSTGIYTGTSLLFHNYGNYNTFIGEDAGNTTMTGNGYNTVIGVSSMYNNLSGERNSTVGYASLISNTTGKYNSAFGGQSLTSNKIGNSNTALGYSACKNSYLDPTYGVYIGSEISSGITGTSDTSRASVYNEIVIGANATGHGSNTVTIGNSSITGNYFNGSIIVPSFTLSSTQSSLTDTYTYQINYSNTVGQSYAHSIWGNRTSLRTNPVNIGAQTNIVSAITELAKYAHNHLQESASDTNNCTCNIYCSCNTYCSCNDCCHEE